MLPIYCSLTAAVLGGTPDAATLAAKARYAALMTRCDEAAAEAASSRGRFEAATASEALKDHRLKMAQAKTAYDSAVEDAKKAALAKSKAAAEAAKQKQADAAKNKPILPAK